MNKNKTEKPTSTQTAPSRPRRILGFTFAFLGYLGFFASFGIFIVATMGYASAWGLSAAPTIVSVPLAVVFNLTLLAGFVVQHTVMARSGFKKWWTQFVPQALERATYVWAANIALALVSVFWARVPGAVWSVEQPLAHWGLWVLGICGWVGVAGASFLIDHFELFGLRQAYFWLKGESLPSSPFRTPGAYRVIRHPMMLGMLVGFWATPQMDAVRLFMAGSMTLYILFGTRKEERDLVQNFGSHYEAYQREVPALIPGAFAIERAFTKSAPSSAEIAE